MREGSARPDRAERAEATASLESWGDGTVLPYRRVRVTAGPGVPGGPRGGDSAAPRLPGSARGGAGPAAWPGFRRPPPRCRPELMNGLCGRRATLRSSLPSPPATLRCQFLIVVSCHFPWSLEFEAIPRGAHASYPIRGVTEVLVQSGEANDEVQCESTCYVKRDPFFLGGMGGHRIEAFCSCIMLPISKKFWFISETSNPGYP